MKNRGNVKISSLLDSDNTLGVLESQRDYTWKKDEADEFLCDLLDHLKQERNLFLGTIVINTADSDKIKKELIVDGQQRITTINLFLIAARQRMKELGDVLQASRIQQKIYLTDQVTSEDLEPRFIASPSINDLFQIMLKNDWDGNMPTKIGKLNLKKQIKLINPVYSHFTSKLSKYNSEEIADLLRTLYSTDVARIDVMDNSEALGVFERLNARGVGLVISDLLKNELFRKIPDDARESWQSIVDNSNGSTERMLKYFYVSQKGYVQKKDLFSKLKDIAKDTSTKELLCRLEDFSEIYRILSRGTKEDLKAYLEEKELVQLSEFQYRYEEIYSCIEALRLFKITQYYPLFYSAISSLISGDLKDSEEAAKKFLNICRNLERYHFINNMVCERVGNEVEKPYATNAANFYTGSFDKGYKEFIDFVNKTKATESEFISRFIDIWYEPQSTIPLLMYIFDRFSNENVIFENRIKLYNPALLKKRNHNIEHFYPRTPGAELQSLQPKPSNNDNIGNLLAISMKVNSSLQNKSPQEKIDQLKGPLANQLQNHIFIGNFIDEYGKKAKHWNDSDISERAETMAKNAYKKVWKI